MRSLLQVVAGGSAAGRDLPEITPSCTQATIKFRQGQLQVVMALPGRGKTLLALWYAIKSGLDCLYFSFDSDEGTISNRAAAIMMDKTTSEVKAMRDTPAIVEVEDALSEMQKRVRFNFSGTPTMDDVYEETEAWVELFGTTPDLIVVDNLLNLRGGSDSEFTALRDSMAALHGLARDTESSVILLHHVNSSLLSAQSKSVRIEENKPAHFGAMMGQLGQLPESVYSVALDGNRYHIAAVKNRDGIADPSANSFVTLGVDLPRMSLYNDMGALEVARTRREWS